MPFPFEVPFDDVEDNLDTYVTEIFSCLQSEFLTLPKGPGFVEYSAFMGVVTLNNQNGKMTKSRFWN